MLIGLVGKPSSGKSTFFQALTAIPVERSSRPFTTIEPNTGVGYVEIECVDKDFKVQCNPRTGFCINSRRFVPVKTLDVAGLVPGAHEGKGLGNKFLDDLRQADILIHVVDASGGTNEIGESVPTGSHDPTLDVKFLEEELNFWIKGILDANWNKLVKENIGINKKKVEEVMVGQFSGLGLKREAILKTLRQLKLEEKPLNEWTSEDRVAYTKILREIGKPIVIAANKCDIDAAQKNYERLKQAFPSYLVIACSAEAEIALKEAAKHKFIDYLPGDSDFKIIKELNEPQTKALDVLRAALKKNGSTGVQKVLNAAVFDYLHYIAVFPGGVSNLEDSEGRIIPDCYLLPPNSTALDFAFALHSDMGKGFIKAVDVKTKLPHGKEHLLKHRDILEIFFKKP